MVTGTAIMNMFLLYLMAIFTLSVQERECFFVKSNEERVASVAGAGEKAGLIRMQRYPIRTRHICERISQIQNDSLCGLE